MLFYYYFHLKDNLKNVYVNILCFFVSAKKRKQLLKVLAIS